MAIHLTNSDGLNAGAAQAARDPAPSSAADNPVEALKSRLRPVVMPVDAPVSEWENALYALIAVKEPKSALHTIFSAMPYKPQMIERFDLLNSMAHLGYFSRPFKAALDTVDVRLFPCLLEPFNAGEDLYVILQKRPEGWQAYNATQGRYEIIEENSIISSKKALFTLFKPYDDSKTLTSRFIRGITGHSWFSAILSRFRSTFAQIFVIGLVLNLFSLLPPLFIMMVYDRVLGAQSLNTLLMLTTGMVLALIIEWMLRNLRGRSLSWLTVRLDNIVGNKIFERLIGLTPQHIENASVTGQIARIRTFETARDFFSGGVFISIIEIPFTALSLLFIYLVAGPLVFVPLIMACVLATQYIALRRMQLMRIRKSARASTIRQQFILDTLENLPTIRANGMLDLWFQKFRQISGRDATAHFRMQWVGALAETMTQTVSMIGLILLITFGTHLIWAGEISTGGLVASMILIWKVLGPFQSLCLSIPRIEQLYSSVRQVNQIMELESEEFAGQKTAKIPRMRGKLTFENVIMRYHENGDLIHKNLTFSLEAGQAMAITGPAGTGKSTIFKIIQGMYAIDSGYVRIDDFDIRQLNVHDIRRQVSYIPQTLDFFRGSILDNLRIANPLAREDDIERALHFSGALADIQALPEGLKTNLQAADREFMSPSFGFKMALARMHVQDAPIVLIDELPNHFQEGDIGSILYKAIDRMRGKRTLLFVTFRRDYLALSDYILTLNSDRSSKLEPVDILFQ